MPAQNFQLLQRKVSQVSMKRGQIATAPTMQTNQMKPDSVLTPLSYVMMLFSDTGTWRSTKPRLFLTKNNPFGLLPNFSWSKIHAWLSMAQSLRLISDGNTLPAAQIASEWWLSLIPSNHARHSLAEKIYYKLWNVSLMLLMHMTSRGKKWKQGILIWEINWKCTAPIHGASGTWYPETHPEWS